MPVPATLEQRDDFEVIKSFDSGLSRNRNHALAHGHSPYVLIGDDDVDYDARGLLDLIEAFEHTGAEVICVRYRCQGNYVKPYGDGQFDLRHAPHGWYITSFELAFARNAASGLRFHELLGLGAPELVAGEETVFLYDLLKRCNKGIGIPVDIGNHDSPTTGERMATSETFLRSHGAVIRHIKPLTWPLRLLLHAWRTPMPFFKCLRATLRGVAYARVHRI